MAAPPIFTGAIERDEDLATYRGRREERSRRRMGWRAGWGAFSIRQPPASRVARRARLPNNKLQMIWFINGFLAIATVASVLLSVAGLMPMSNKGAEANSK